MTGKSNSQSRRRAGALWSRLRSFSAALSDQSVVDATVGLLIIVGLSFLLLRNYQRTEIEVLPVGSVATTDILAPEDFKIEDEVETQRLRVQAEASVLPVYDYNPRASREVRKTVEDIFQAGRDASGDLSSEQLLGEIEQKTGIILDREQLQALSNHRFNYELEKLMTDHLEAALAPGVVTNRGQFVRAASNGFIRWDKRTDNEVTVTDPAMVRDLVTARAALRSERLVWPAEYSQSERRFLVEILGLLIVPNLSFDEEETERRKQAARDSVAPFMLAAERGRPIVVAGETVTPAKAALLKAAATRRPIGYRAIEFAGTFVIVMLLVLVLWQYMLSYQQRHLRVRRHFILQIAIVGITLALARLFFALGYVMSQWVATAPFNSQAGYRYLAPLAAGAALVTILTDAHAAFVFSAILTVFVGVLSGNVHLAAYTLICSVGAIYHLQNCRDRTALMRAGLWIGLVNAAAALALNLLGANDQLRLDSSMALLTLLFDAFCAFASGLLAAMVTSLLLPLFEWLFQITTNIKLLELSNLNLPLLKQLAERAPGTYHHSIMVGLLAEKATESIGGDSLFARVSCYYHDIGKMVRPGYFVENQSFAENLHDRLSPKMSSIVLANHVKQGIELAKQHKLPPRIISVIPQHHGTGLMKYFYYKARNSSEDPDSTALEQEFRYPGPKPQAKEAAIIMIADSVEAAARTVKDPTPAKLRNMIEMIITRLRDDGQFDECDITLREMSVVAESFVKVLIGIHHHRIAYPGYDFSRPAKGESPSALAILGLEEPARLRAVGTRRGAATAGESIAD